MAEDDLTIEELLAVRLVREFEDLADDERLEPSGSVPTPDWRVTTADGRVADVEVVWATSEAERKIESQFFVEESDETGLRRRRSRRQWPDCRLSLVWDVRVYDRAPGSNRRTARELVDALIAVLVDVEAAGGASREMVEAARERLIDPQEHYERYGRRSGGRETSTPCADSDDFMLQWGRDTGYWYPQQLVDCFEAPPRRVHVLRVSEPEVPGSGMVRTSAASLSPVFGEYEHMLSTVQRHIDKKTAKRQTRVWRVGGGLVTAEGR